MSLYQKLIDANLPIQSASEAGEIIGLPDVEMTSEQRGLLDDIVMEHFRPTEYADVLADRANMKAHKDNYLKAIARLEQIQNATNITNAQAVAAIKDMALIQERTLKLLKKMFFE